MASEHKSGWPLRSLSSCATYQEGYVNPSQGVPSYFGDDVRWLRAVDLNDSFVHETSRRLSFAGFSSAGKAAKLFRPGSLAISKSGTIGRLGILQAEMCGNRAVINIEPHPDIDTRFLFYSLLANRERIIQMADGSVQKNLYVSQLGMIELHVPPLGAQRAIAETLGSLDDKIEQNRRTGAKLEGLARAVFKAWFVDFEPVQAKAAGQTSFPGMPPAAFAALPDRFVDSEVGLVPEGWEGNVARVDELERKGLLLIGDGYRAKRAELAETGLPFIRAGNVNGTIRTEGAELLGSVAVAKSGVKRSQPWDTVFTSKGTVGRIGLVTPAIGEVVYAPQVCFWRSRKHEELSPVLLHLWMKSPCFTSQWMSVKGQTDMADFVSLSDQRAMKMLVAPHGLQKAADAIVRPLIELQANLADESSKLAALRDYLLPRLLSGRVRVSGCV